MILLDGNSLARERLPGLARRAASVATRRGRPPRLAIVAAAQPGQAPPHVDLKRRAAEAAGVATGVLALPPDSDTDRALAALGSLDAGAADGVFVQYPLPPAVDETRVFDAIPVELDIDILSSAAFRRFEAGTGPAPATAEASMALLDAYGVRPSCGPAVVVGEPSALAHAFEVELARRGAHVRERVPADHAHLRTRLRGARLIVLQCGRPAAVPASAIPHGAVVVDGGYFNPGGRGDLDPRGGTAHLGGLVPVPGGLGPMTVSVLLERTIANAGG